MSPLPMNILAYLAIIAFLGLIGAFVWMALTVKNMIGWGKGVAALFNPPKRSAMEIVDTGKGIGLKSMQRFKSMGARVKTSAYHVQAVAAEIKIAAESIDVEGAKSQAEQTVENVRQSTQLMAMLQQVMNMVRETQAAQSHPRN